MTNSNESLIDKLEALHEFAAAGGNPEVMLDKCIRVVERHWQSFKIDSNDESSKNG